jgi:amidase
MDLHYLELTELADLLQRREVTALEVTRAQLERIGRLDGHLASYARITPELARAAAETADREIGAGRYRGPLHGVPLGIKDLFWTKGVPAAAGTIFHRDFVPDEDATAVARLRRAGAILTGKLQMTEGAYSDHHPAVTPPKNPGTRPIGRRFLRAAPLSRPRPGFVMARSPLTQADRSGGRAALQD